MVEQRAMRSPLLCLPQTDAFSHFWPDRFRLVEIEFEQLPGLPVPLLALPGHLDPGECAGTVVQQADSGAPVHLDQR